MVFPSAASTRDELVLPEQRGASSTLQQLQRPAATPAMSATAGPGLGTAPSWLTVYPKMQ